MSRDADLNDVVDWLKDVVSELGAVQGEIQELKKIAKHQQRTLKKIRKEVR